MKKEKRQKIIRITTIPGSLNGLLRGQLTYMTKHYDVIAISSPNGDELKKFSSKENIRALPVEMTRKITLWKDLKAAFKLYRIFKKEKPFIVHTHTPKAGTLGMLAAYTAKVPHRLHTIAGLPLLEARGFKRLVLDTVEKFTYRFASKIYPNSNGLKKIILDSNFTSEKKLKVIGNGSSNGIDLKVFDPNLYDEDQANKLKESLGINKTDYIFLFVGRLVKDKGINELIEAFNKISLKFSDTKLILVGSRENDLDPLSPETDEIISKNPNIISVGRQTDVRPYFSIANVLTFPSYREGFPNVVLEAGGMGIPSIVTDINGCNEIITHGKNGHIIQTKNTNELYSAMHHFYSNKGDAVKLNKNEIRELIATKYDRLSIWKKILQEYNSL